MSNPITEQIITPQTHKTVSGVILKTDSLRQVTLKAAPFIPTKQAIEVILPTDVIQNQQKIVVESAAPAPKILAKTAEILPVTPPIDMVAQNLNSLCEHTDSQIQDFKDFKARLQG